ncbi:MAG: PDZ domain-containing protein [Sphingobacteriia bacterium]|nr:PDZ domain-containing protein [Sphingobacteriia bacterium]
MLRTVLCLPACRIPAGCLATYTMIRTFIILLVASTWLQGCATPFSEFYYDFTEGVDLTKDPRVVLPTGDPQLYRGTDPEQDAVRMFQDGYILIGYSQFNAGRVDEDDAVRHAKSLHASVVILYSKYTGSVSGVVPLTLPDTSTTTSQVSGIVHGKPYSGTVETTTYGSTTTYMPYTVHRSDYLATYWMKLSKTPAFGVVIIDLTPENKQHIGSNQGMLIYAVIKGSPAFQADLLEGDILRAIGDSPVFDQDTFNRAVDRYQGTETDVTLFRGTREIHRSVKIGADQ